jgi:hypothetical protein
MPSNAAATDDMIRRLETELREKTNFANEIISRAQMAERDLTDEEKTLVGESRGRMEVIKDQLSTIEDVSRVSFDAAHRAQQVGEAIRDWKGRHHSGPVEYRSAGQYLLDNWQSARGDNAASERLDVFHRAADHDKTGDVTGIVPDPIVGDVINFIDAARPLVNFLGARAMPAATWHRPLVTQHTSVGAQGTAGAAADEKTELVSQKMVITRLTGQAVTYGGYVNVSRQVVDFSTPAGLDAVVNDLAAQYAIETEAATAAAVTAVSTTAVTYDTTPTTGTVQDALATAIWSATGQVYTAVRGMGKLFIVISPDVLGTFGPLFAPYGPFNQFGQGFNAANFGQGVMGNISGVPVVMSAGFGTGKAFLASTAAIEFYEQRIGALQIVEPSVLGIQVAYAGYATPMIIKEAGIVPLTAA